MNIYVFKRYELKYLITPTQYLAIMREARQYLTPDAHGEATVQSLYYDTDDYRLIRRSLERPEYKEKLRVRSYGLAHEGDTVFIELKKKCSGIVYKRRIETKFSDGENISTVISSDGSQISREIAYFMDFYGDPRPKMLLLYDRTAYFGEGDLRITFDRNIRYRTDRLSLDASLDGRPVRSDGRILMEVKTGTAIPLWLTGILSRERIFKTSFSKYGEAYKIERSSSIAEVQKVG